MHATDLSATAVEDTKAARGGCGLGLSLFIYMYYITSYIIDIDISQGLNRDVYIYTILYILHIYMSQPHVHATDPSATAVEVTRFYEFD